MTRVLIVDDDPVQLRLTAEIARSAGFLPRTAAGGDEALGILRAEPGFAAVILDLVMPDRDGMAVMDAMAREGIKTPVIVQTARSERETVTAAMNRGAVDFFVKPVAPERLIVSLRNVLRLRELEAALRADQRLRAGTLTPADLVGASPVMLRPLGLVAKAAKSPLPILIEGEAGTGKALLARVIHGSGERAGRPFVMFDCAALPASAIDAALFGHRGAGRTETGRLAEANGGTLYLREVGELPADAQERLLSLIESGTVMPAGAGRAERHNVRVIAGTSRRLLNLAQSGEFREDLYYRLNVLPIYVPPLRERPEDIAPLAATMIARVAAELGRPAGALAPETRALLQAYAWPGNVGELETSLHRAAALGSGGDLQPADFPRIVAQIAGRDEALRLAASLPVASAPVHIDTVRPLRQRSEEPEAAPDRFIDGNGDILRLDHLERELIAFALSRHGGHMSRVARALGIGRSTLYRKLREYGLGEPESDAA